MDFRVTLDEAASRLGVTRRRAQALVSSGLLLAEKVGVQWLVPVGAIGRYAHTSVRRPGRPLSQAGAWIELADSERRHGWSTPERDALRRRLRPRARHSDFFVHPGALELLRSFPGVVLSGRDAAADAGAPVDATEVDVYVRAGEADVLLQSVKAQAAFDDANVHLHVVDDDAWPFKPDQRVVSPWLAWLDLEDRQDRAAPVLLDRIAGGRARA